MLPSTSPSPCHALPSRHWPGLDLWVKRDDLLHPQVSGNKFRKLKYPLLALQGQRVRLVSMGGPWSNHLHALAHAAAQLGHASLALVRGPEQASACLDDCRALGMQVRLVDRDDYRRLRDEGGYWRNFAEGADALDCVWLPEGGSAPEALRGVAELVDELPFVPDSLMVACGTGATLAGLAAGLRGRGRAVGVAALKNADYLRAEIAGLLQRAGYPAYDNIELLTGYHQGGYAKAPPALLEFCLALQAETGLPLEPVYTGKLFFAVKHLAAQGYFRPGERVVAVHTGGLQGARGFILTELE